MPVHMPVALLTSKAEHVHSLGLDHLLDRATDPIDPALELEVFRLSKVTHHALDVPPWTDERVPAQRRTPIEEDQDLRILVNHNVRAPVFRVTLSEQADKAGSLSHPAFVRRNVEADSLGHSWYNARSMRHITARFPISEPS